MSGRVISNTFVINTVEDGENAVVLTLDNEHEDFLYNDAGSNLTGTVTSQATLMDGGTAVGSGVTFSISDDNRTNWGTSTSTNSTANINSSGLLTVTALKANVVKITVRALYGGNYYFKDFTANKTSSDTYELVLTPNSVTYNSANFTSKNIAISAERLDKSGARTTINFGVYTNPSKISATGSKGYLRLWVSYTKNVAPGASQDVYARVTEQVTSTPWTIDSVSASRDDEVSFKLLKYDNYNTTDTGGTVGTMVDFQSVPIPKAENGQQGEQGQQGERGKVGRWFYYAGVFDENNNTDKFLVNDAQAPFFLTKASPKEYHVFDYETNGRYSMADMWDLTEESGNPPQKSFNNYPWEVMVNDFKYLITEAIFGAYAHFGSSIINGDFLMSQLGYIRGFNGFQQDISTDDTYYLNFNPNEPFGTEDLSLYNSGNQSQWIINNYTLYEEPKGVVWNTPYALPNILFKLRANRWYTLEIRAKGSPLNYKIAKTADGTVYAQGTIPAQERNTAYFSSYITFQAPSEEVSLCKIFVQGDHTGNVPYGVQGVYLRFAQFVPNFVVDMRTGEMAANKLNGRLSAKYFNYDTTMKLSMQNVIVENESFVCLTNDAGTLITLPKPAVSKGRVIEIFNASSDWGLKWDGATISDYFKVATRSINGYYRTWNRADGSSSMGNYVKYLKLWCDGQIWWVIDYNYGENLFPSV